METRKVQVTGGSTYTVSIPKGWATDNDVEAGSVVEFHPEDDSLLLTPREERGSTEGELDVGDLSGDELTRAVMTMYVSGFDVVRFTATRITADQRQTIRKTAQGLVGLEVLEETGESVVVRDLLDSSDLSIDNAVTRMRLIALSMLDDAVAALTEDDDDLAADVIARDDDVDRLYLMVSRIFRATLRDPGAAAALGLPRETCFDYHAAARQLERVGDHATKIAHLTRNVETPPPEVAEALEELHAEARAVIDTAMDALFAGEDEDPVALANEARSDILDIDEHARAIDELLRELDPYEAQQLGLVVDSLSRSADYGGNVAETALQNAAPTP
jgi:phosphate uptake regulator